MWCRSWKRVFSGLSVRFRNRLKEPPGGDQARIGRSCSPGNNEVIVFPEVAETQTFPVLGPPVTLESFYDRGSTVAAKKRRTKKPAQVSINTGEDTARTSRLCGSS